MHQKIKKQIQDDLSLTGVILMEIHDNLSDLLTSQEVSTVEALKWIEQIRQTAIDISMIKKK